MHPAQEELLGWFGYEQLRAPQQEVSKPCHDLATDMAERLQNSRHGAEVTAGLRKLLEAKDCFVRASLP